MAERVITVDDLIRSGACLSGVRSAVARLEDKVAAAMPVSVVLRIVEPSERRYVLRAAELDGDGDGDGYGYGCGYGDGGNGGGDGYGDGYGYGDGGGDGYGGYGYGYGYGYGDGGGDGYGGYGGE